MPCRWQDADSYQIFQSRLQLHECLWTGWPRWSDWTQWPCHSVISPYKRGGTEHWSLTSTWHLIQNNLGHNVHVDLCPLILVHTRLHAEFVEKIRHSPLVLPPWTNHTLRDSHLRRKQPLIESWTSTELLHLWIRLLHKSTWLNIGQCACTNCCTSACCSKFWWRSRISSEGQSPCDSAITFIRSKKLQLKSRMRSTGQSAL